MSRSNREALEMHLEDLEDAYLGELILQRVSDGSESVYGLDEVEKELCLDD